MPNGADHNDHQIIYIKPELIPDREPSEELKSQVKSRDGNRCLCCGKTRGKREVDHVRSFYVGGSNQLDNLQTLCRIRNQAKGKDTVNFRVNRTPLGIEPGPFLADWSTHWRIFKET